MESSGQSAYPDAMIARARKRAKPSPAPPSPADEKAAFIRSLEKHGQAVECEGPLPPGATHTLKKRANGTKVVKRRRFSAV
jgi:hypothetical protein